MNPPTWDWMGVRTKPLTDPSTTDNVVLQHSIEGWEEIYYSLLCRSKDSNLPLTPVRSLTAKQLYEPTKRKLTFRDEGKERSSEDVKVAEPSSTLSVTETTAEETQSLVTKANCLSNRKHENSGLYHHYFCPNGGGRAKILRMDYDKAMAGEPCCNLDTTSIHKFKRCICGLLFIVCYHSRHGDFG